MSTPERHFDVCLNEEKAGTLRVRDDFTSFVLAPEYIANPRRAVLGLRFEQDLTARHQANLRLPPWFSNLLPEGALRQWIADARGVSADREMQLLAEVGHDLPGAVLVRPADEGSSESTHERVASAPLPPPRRPDAWRFSLAGVGMKFSLVSTGERFTAPGVGEGGDWIVKLPDTNHPSVPLNEFTMMRLAQLAGLTVPEIRLVHRDLIENVPAQLWPEREEHAFAIRRFDRTETRERIHIEDLAQVRDFYPEAKYSGSFETVAALIYRQHDLSSLQEFVRRIAFNIIIRNGDAHLKNWSLIYRNPRIPELSPAYDLVSTALYHPQGLPPENLGLTLGKSRRFEAVTLSTFARLQQRLGVSAVSFADEVEALARRVLEAWPEARETAESEPWLHHALDAVVRDGASSLLRKT